MATIDKTSVDRGTTKAGHPGAGRGAGHPVHPPLVHRHPRPAQELRRRQGRARGRAQGGHGLRRLVDHRLQPDRGVGHDRDARPDTFAVLPWRPQEKAVARMFCDVLVPGGEPYEGDPRYVMRRALARAQEMGFDHFYIGPELEFFYFRQAELNGGPPEVLDKGGYFDLTTLDAASDLRRDTVLALEAARHRRRVHAPRGRARPSTRSTCASPTGCAMADNAMTYRIAVKEIAMKYGVYATFMPKPLFGENGSGMHVHQSLFSGEQQRVLRPGRRVPPEPGREVVHRGPAQARARDLGAVRAVGQLVQAAGARLRGAGLHRLVAAQPLGADPGADVPPRQGAGDARRASLPGPGLQPVPDLRGDAARRPRGHREGLRAARPDGDEPLRPDRGRARRGWASSSCPRRSARRSRSWPAPSWC